MPAIGYLDHPVLKTVREDRKIYFIKYHDYSLRGQVMMGFNNLLIERKEDYTAKCFDDPKDILVKEVSFFS